MTTEEPRQDSGPGNGGNGNGGSNGNGDDDCRPPEGACDPLSIDKVACRAEGIAAQAKYDTTYTADLETAKADYDTARKAYRDARKQAALPYKEMRHQAKHLLERIRCMIEQRKVWVCLDDAYCEVVHELDCCQHPPGCCARERDFDVTGADALGLHSLDRLIKRYQRWTTEAKDCFEKLKGEPAALTDRVAKAKAALTDVETALNGDAAATDLKLQYAKAKVAQRMVEQVYAGFTHSQDYVDCLCLALTTWTDGCRSVSELTRIQAEKECCERLEEQRCTELATNTVDEILAVYDRMCGTDPCDDDGPSGDDDDCGCHHHDDEDDDDSDDDSDEDDDDSDDEVCSKCGRRHRHHRHHHKHHHGCGCGESHDSDDDDSDEDSEDSGDSEDSDEGEAGSGAKAS